MKVRLNKKVLADMDPRVRALVVEWKNRWHKAFICVSERDGFYAEESARVTMINLATGRSHRESVAGEMAGMTRLSPTDKIPVPPGCVAVETGFFCGEPFLTIYQCRAAEPSQDMLTVGTTTATF
jgi:hypothetical protein